MDSENGTSFIEKGCTYRVNTGMNVVNAVNVPIYSPDRLQHHTSAAISHHDVHQPSRQRDGILIVRVKPWQQMTAEHKHKSDDGHHKHPNSHSDDRCSFGISNPPPSYIFTDLYREEQMSVLNDGSMVIESDRSRQT